MTARDLHREIREMGVSCESSAEQRHAVEGVGARMMRVRLARQTPHGEIAVEALCATYEDACEQAVLSMRAILDMGRGPALVVGETPPQPAPGPGAR